MATFRSNPTIALVMFSLAGVAREGAPAAASNQSPAAVEVATIQNLRIERLTPRRDFVGENEIEIPVFDQDGIKTMSVPWPKEARVEAGTYYWRIVGLKGNRIVADSGRAAFVVLEHQPQR